MGIFLVALAIGAAASWRYFRGEGERQLALAESEAEAIVAAGKAEAAAERAKVIAESKEKALEKRGQAQESAQKRLQELRRQDADASRRLSLATDGESALSERQVTIDAREATIRSLEDGRRSREEANRKLALEEIAKLESNAGENRCDVRTRMVNEWIEQSKAEAAEKLRRATEEVSDGERGRDAKRMMDIAIQRYQGHYLTERLLSNLPLLPGAAERIAGVQNANLAIIEEVANIKLTLADDLSAIRLEGQDSFGREIARRAISLFGRNGTRDARKSALLIKDELEREVFEFGKRAFKELGVERAHPDIVKLVGRLNWRTSYTQNQWKHAIEAAFLCGMIADEMGLDVKLARRAALMHDIGKSLTHAIDGSHAVIGADYARRLGESEVVANAIGAHHGDEPCNSVYASLVAACDAMSGARPGARREQTDNYVQKLDDLERIGSDFAGVDRAFAVQGGREVRVYVLEDRVSDERAVELSAEIATRISDEMTFPGQIKVTVIREVHAVEVAN